MRTKRTTFQFFHLYTTILPVHCSLPELLTHDVASHLVEQILSIVPAQLYSDILQQLSGQLVTMAMHPTANFVLQSLIGHTHDEAQVGRPSVSVTLWHILNKPLTSEYKVWLNLEFPEGEHD